ncbi:APC family permease [Eubacteriaceae bacterium ES2]|nr:APC family permease [Eubacteriaceae bacterium ES2]
MNKSESKFDKVLSTKDIFVIAFGAMIGWGWVVNTGIWIESAGALGAALAFLIGGIMVLFVGLTYAELTAAMPQCGGEHVFSYKAMGPTGSFICTWAIILGYVSVVAFEACAFPTVIQYLSPNFLKGYMYTVAGFDIYASWVAVGVITAIIITAINILGAKTAAKLQTILTVLIAGAGILLIAGSVMNGDVSNISANMFTDVAESGSTALGGVLTVAVMTPFLFVGFDVIPQAAEEINAGFKKIGMIMILSIVMAVAFYALIILAVAYVMPLSAMADSNLVTADAMAYAFGSSIMTKVLIVGGMAGIITSWNSFMIGGSRAMFSMAESNMIPNAFAKLHPKYKTPVYAIALIGLISVIAPFFGRKMLVWIVDAGSFGVCLAYAMVSASFLILRKAAPDMKRPYKVRFGMLIGSLALILSGLMTVLYVVPLPFASTALVAEEWIMAGGWAVLGLVFYVYCKAKYKEEFGRHIDVVYEDIDEQVKKPVRAKGVLE